MQFFSTIVLALAAAAVSASPVEKRQAAADVEAITNLNPALDSVTTAFNQLPSSASVTVGSVLAVLGPLIQTQSTIAANPLTIPDEHGGAFGNSDSTSILSAFQEVQGHLNTTLAAISAKTGALQQTFTFPSGSSNQFTLGGVVADVLTGFSTGIAGTVASVDGALVAAEGTQVSTILAQMQASIKTVIAQV